MEGEGSYERKFFCVKVLNFRLRVVEIARSKFLDFGILINQKWNFSLIPN